MADPFRKRKKKSSRSRSKLNHFELENGLSDLSTSTASLSFQFEEHNLHDSGARTPLSNPIESDKKKRKMRKKRLKAFQRSIDRSSSNDGDGPTKLHSNIGVYTADYLQSLKQENKAMSAPKALDQNVINLVDSDSMNKMNERNPMTTSSASDSDNEEEERLKDMEHDEILRAKILTSKLQRRTKALAHAIDQHAENAKNGIKPMKSQNGSHRIDLTDSNEIRLDRFGVHIGKRTGTLLDEEEHDLQEDDQLHQFVPLGKLQNQRDKMRDIMDQDARNQIDLTMDENEDAHHFEAQQMQKSGVSIDTITIDDDHGLKANDLKTLNVSKSTAWNRWNEEENGLTLDAVYKLIDDEINGSQNVVRPPMGSYHVSYEQVESEYRDIGHQIEVNKKQRTVLEAKDSFFQTLNNEVTAYLNCISEKQVLIEKYLTMELDLRRQRHQMVQQWQCLNHLESFQEAFYPNDFTKDITAAAAFEKLSDLNSTMNPKEDSIPQKSMNSNSMKSIFQMDRNGEATVWNPESGSLDQSRYLIHKKRRRSTREEYQRTKRRKLNHHQITININRNLAILDDAADVLEAPFDCDSAMTLGLDFEKVREQIVSEMKGIFEDTRPEYRSFDGMKVVLEEWKREYPKEYGDAFVSISVPKLIAPFIRMELMEWNPLKYIISTSTNQKGDEMESEHNERDSTMDTAVDMESDIWCPPKLFVHCSWYRLMAEYGLDEEGTMKEGDPDDRIVPTLVASLVIPRLITVVEYDWNPYSKRESQQLQLQMECALEHIDIDGDKDTFKPKMNALRKAIKCRGKLAVSNLVNLKCLSLQFRNAIFPNFKEFAPTPLHYGGSKGKEQESVGMDGLPGSLKYEFLRNRVSRALVLMENLCIVLNANECVEIVENLYTSIIQGFVTFLGRCPSRNASGMMEAQEMVLGDFCEIVKGMEHVVEGKNSRKQSPDEDEDDDDVQMKDDTKDDKIRALPQSVLKHLKRSISEIDTHLNPAVKSKLCDRMSFLNSFLVRLS